MSLDLSYLAVLPWAAYGCDPFGDDTTGNLIWEKSDGEKDIVKGDGSTASTMPTLVTNEPGVSYYQFDGVDDYLSDWPVMPAAYTVSAAFSASYPGGKPYVTQVHDTTIETLLTTPGSFTGNLHNLLIFNAELSDLEKAWFEAYQLRRLWRDTVVNPYSARLIRDGDTLQAYVFIVQASPYTDYSDTGATPSPSGITWDEGLTFTGGASVATVSDEAALRSDPVSIFASGDFAAGHVCDKGTNYELSVSYSAGALIITVNGVASPTIAIDNLYSIGVVIADGDYPLFYVNGRYVATGTTTVAVDDTDTNDLLIGNQAGGGDQFTGTLRRLSVFGRPLVDTEFEMLHLAAQGDL